MQAWASKGRVWTTGIEFGTVAAQRGDTRVEVTTFRTERYEPGSRNPTVAFATDLETDLSRRDFTVNAMAIELPDVALIDPFGGLDDLAQGRLRTPLSPEVAFGDDPLRMLRALRFASTLDFAIDPGVVAAIRELHGGLAIISAERIREEFSKLLAGRSPSAALALATEVGLAAEFIPELPLLRLEQDPIHRHKDVFAHTLAVLDNAIALEPEGPDLVLRLAALLHHPQPSQGRPALGPHRRARSPHQGACRPGGADGPSPGAERQPGHGASGDRAGPGRRPGARPPDGNPSRRGRDPGGRSLRPPRPMVGRAQRGQRLVTQIPPAPDDWWVPLARHLGEAYLQYAFTMGTAQEVEFIAETLGATAGERLLDVGCGPGRHSLEFAKRGLQVLGIDISPRFMPR